MLPKQLAYHKLKLLGGKDTRWRGGCGGSVARPERS